MTTLTVPGTKEMRPTSSSFQIEDTSTLSFGGKIISYAKALPLHIYRAFNTSSLGSLANVATKEEKQYLKRVNPALSECDDASLNLIAWRRSALCVMMVFTCLNTILAISAAVDVVDDTILNQELASLSLNTTVRLGYARQEILDYSQITNPLEYVSSYHDLVYPYYVPPAKCKDGCEQWDTTIYRFLPNDVGTQCAQPINLTRERPWCFCKNDSIEFGYCSLDLDYMVEEPFHLYTLRVLKIGNARMIVDVKVLDELIEIGTATLTGLAFLMNIVAFYYWDRYRLSRSYLLIGWFFFFFTPFVITCVPVRMAVRWDDLDPVTQVYYTEFAQKYKLVEKEQQVIDVCKKIQETDGGQEVRESLGDMCGSCSYMDGGEPWWHGFKEGQPCPGEGAVMRYVPRRINVLVKKWDFSGVHKNCGRIRNFMRKENSQEALNAAKEGCAELVTVLEDQPGSASDLMSVVAQFIERSKALVELLIGLGHALLGLKIMVPAAISLAPALLQAALKVKTLVPQSSIPGMFVLILPWLYCPIVWTLYNIVFQLIGNEYLLLGLILLAYTPMFYCAVGMYFNITQPMTDEQGVAPLKWLGRVSMPFRVVAYSLLIVFFINSEHKGQVFEELKKKLQNVSSLVEIAIATASKYLYTRVVGIDYMLNEIVKQRKYELSLEFGDNVKKTVNSINKEKKINAASLRRDRDKRLDDLLKLIKPREVRTNRN